MEGTWDSHQVDLAGFERIGALDDHLAVIATSRADGTVQASVVNAGVLPHPVSREPVVGFVTYGKTKLGNLRARPWPPWCSGQGGNGRAWKVRASSSVLTTRSADSHPRTYLNSSVLSFASLAAVTRTGRTTTGS